MTSRRPRPQIIQGSIIRILKPNDVNREWVVTHIPDGRYLTGADAKAPKAPKEQKTKPKAEGEQPQQQQRSPAVRALKKSVAPTASPALSTLPAPLAIPPPIKTVKKSKKRSRSKPEHATPQPAGGKVFESVLVTDVEIELDFLEAYKYYVSEAQASLQEYVDSEATASDTEECKQRKARVEVESEGENEEKEDLTDGHETSEGGYDSTPQKQQRFQQIQLHQLQKQQQQLQEKKRLQDQLLLHANEGEGKFPSPASASRLHSPPIKPIRADNNNNNFASPSRTNNHSNYVNYSSTESFQGERGLNLDHHPSRFSQGSFMQFPPYQQ